jgi:hypothetical protein
MNAIRELPRTSLLQAESLFQDKHLGIGIQLQFRTLRVLITHAMPLTHPLIPGQFVFGVMAKVNPSSGAALCAVNLSQEQIFVLRIQDLEPLPEPGSREHALCQRLWQHANPGLEESLGVMRCEVLGAFEAGSLPGELPTFSSTMHVQDVAHRMHVYRADRAVMAQDLPAMIGPSFLIASSRWAMLVGRSKTAWRAPL